MAGRLQWMAWGIAATWFLLAAVTPRLARHQHPIRRGLLSAAALLSGLAVLAWFQARQWWFWGSGSALTLVATAVLLVPDSARGPEVPTKRVPSSAAERMDSDDCESLIR